MKKIKLRVLNCTTQTRQLNASSIFNSQFSTIATTNNPLVLNSVPNCNHQNAISLSKQIYESTKLNDFSRAIRIASQMLSQNITLDTHVLPSLIKACAGLSLLKTAKQVHCFASVSGFVFDTRVSSSLVLMYIKNNRIKDAHKVFDEMPQPDVIAHSALLAAYAKRGCVKETRQLLFSRRNGDDLGLNLVSWNGIISGFNHSGYHQEAVVMFQRMHFEGFKPEGTSISSVLSAIGDLGKLEIGCQIHGYVIKEGLRQDNCVVSALVDVYGKCTRVIEMIRVYNEFDQMDVGVFNALITGLSRNGFVDKALEVFRELKAQMQLNVVSWTSIIASCSQNGKDIVALELFREMQVLGVKPNSVTIPCLLPACGNIAALMHGKSAHCFSLKNGISDNVYVGSALIDMYAKCGRIHVSRRCFDMMPTRNLVSWNALMAGYAMHGKTKEAIEIFQLMKRCWQKPDFISFVCVLSACSQGGFTDEGQGYFNSMLTDYGIEPRLEHYACMVNLLGRAGRVQEAYDMIKQMPIKPDACVWGALLSSCRVHSNVSLGEIAAKELFELEPENPGNYILLSNIFASKAMWDEVHMVRDMMKNRGLKKNPGCSWIEVKGKVHMLLASDNSHPQMTRITEKITELSMEMKKSGCFPDTNFVLQDVEEHDKEQILCGHSEKLAVVLGLLNTSPGLPLQVIKNLRICGDCHSVIKFISGYEKREIFVRDTNRFHHFRDGVCSCGDYW